MCVCVSQLSSDNDIVTIFVVLEDDITSMFMLKLSVDHFALAAAGTRPMWRTADM